MSDIENKDQQKNKQILSDKRTYGLFKDIEKFPEERRKKERRERERRKPSHAGMLEEKRGGIDRRCADRRNINEFIDICTGIKDVYSALKHPEDFPHFVSGINKISIRERKDHFLRVDWEIDIEGVTIKWQEQDSFEDIANDKKIIKFRLIDGDFNIYEGYWQLISQGKNRTSVKFVIHYDFGLPVISLFMGHIIKEKLENFYQSLLIALKRELERHRKEYKKFSFLVHPLGVELFSSFEKNALQKRKELISNILKWGSPFKISAVKGVRSEFSHEELPGDLILCNLFPEHIIHMDSKIILRKIIEAGLVAQDLGAKILGVGAYISEVGKKGVLIERNLDIPVTTGLHYTIVIVMKAIDKALMYLEKRLKNSVIAVIGASGSIGSTIVHILSDKNTDLKFELIARNLSKLERIFTPLKDRGIEANFSKNIPKSIKNADVVITATSSPTTLINVNDLKPGAVVLDISLPKNVPIEAASLRKDVFFIDGGIVKPPGDVDFNLYYGLPPGLCYACLAETMILAFEGKFESYSIGGKISLDKVKEINQLGEKHGFSLAKLMSFGLEISERHIDRVKSIKNRL